MNIMFKIVYFTVGYIGKNGKEVVGLKVTRRDEGVVRLRKLFRDKTVGDRWSCDTPEGSMFSTAKRIERDLSTGKRGKTVTKKDAVEALDKQETVKEPDVVKVEIAVEEIDEILCQICGKQIHDFVAVTPKSIEPEPVRRPIVDPVKGLSNIVYSSESVLGLVKKVDNFINTVTNPRVLKALRTSKGRSTAASGIATMTFIELANVLSGAVTMSGAATFNDGGISIKSTLSLVNIIILISSIGLFF